MLNFQHEPDSIRGKSNFGFLWIDYFHDSHIKTTTVSENGTKLEMTVSCSREAEDDFNSGKRFVDSNEWLESGMYDYVISFSDCKSIEMEMEPGLAVEYLNGRFKNFPESEILRKRNRRRYYKFRIQLWPGNITVVFSKLEVAKLHGIKRIPKWFGKYGGVRASHATSETPDKDGLISDILAGDYEGQQALLALFSNEDEDCLKYARIMLDRETSEDDWIASVFVIGELGDESDLGALWSKISKLEKWDKHMGEPHIRDAIAKIEHRMSNVC